MVKIIVLCYLRQIFFKRSRMMNAVNESKPDVGSSSKIASGSVTSSTPIEVLLRSPPETPFIRGPPI